MTSEGQDLGDAEKTQPKKQPKRPKRERRELRVAFDTNVLFTGSASDLVRQEATSLILQSKFPDLNIQWYLPEIVRLERQFQMQKGALELLSPLAKVEKLLGHNLNITESILTERVGKVIEQRQRDLGLMPLKPENVNIDWDQLILSAAFRKAPFQDGKNEKGFRDALVVESFIHLLNISPKTPRVCRIVLVTGDGLLAEAVRARIVGANNAEVLGNLEELRGLINILVSQVDEAFLASLLPKAERFFFIQKDESTLFYKEQVRAELGKKFVAEFAARPEGATSRKNGTWRISAPNFSKKTAQRIQWTSRIQIETEASKTVRDDRMLGLSSEPSPADPYRSASMYSSPLLLTSPSVSPLVLGSQYLPESSALVAGAKHFSDLFNRRTIVTHKGRDVYDVLWSVDITKSLDLRRPSIDDIVHVEGIWEAVA